MAYRGAIFNKKGGTMLHLIKGKLNAKSQGPNDMPFEKFSRHTDIVAYRGA